MSSELPRLRKNVATPKDAEMGPTPRSPQGPGQRTPAPATAKTPQSVPPPPPQDDAGVSEATRHRVKKVFVGIIVAAALAGIGYAIYSRATKGGVFGKGSNDPEDKRIQKKQDELPKFPTCAIQGNLGMATFYNGLFSGGYYGKNGLVEGRLAIGGNAEVIDWTVGTGLNFGNKCPTSDAKDFGLSNYTLIVDGVFTAFRPLVQNGGVAYGIDKGGVGMTSTDIGTNCPFVMKKNVLDFINVVGQLQLVDALISQMPGALAYSEVFALTYTMYVNKNIGHQYFVVEEADFLDANYIVLDGEVPKVNGSTASVIVRINMDPSNTAKSISLGARGFSGFDAIKDRLIWHFPGYSTITLQNVGWPGAILALDASFENMTGDIYGSVFAKSWNLWKKPDAALHINKFAGTAFGVNCNSTYVKVNGTDSNTTADYVTPTCPLAGNLGIAPNYNGFFSGSYYAINTNVGGRLACGVNINVTNFAAGNNMYSPSLSCPIPGNSATFSFANYALVAMENLTSWNASVFNGGAIYGLYDGNGESVLGVGSGCPKGQIWSGFNFPMDDTFTQLNLASSTINSLTGNFSFSSLAGGKYLNLYLNGNTTAEIFHVTEADLASCTTVILLGTPLNNNATIVINIKKGSSNGVLSIASKNFIGFSSSLRNYVLWNFNGYSRITLNNFGWPGSILAPTAAFEQMVGQIDGSVFGKSWNQQKNANTAELGYRPFVGIVPTTDCGV